MSSDAGAARPLVRAGIVLGVGLGGFADGIVFHQLLQLHGMLTARLPKDSIANVQVNMFWDGIFHVFTWIMTVAGVFLLLRAGRPRAVEAPERTVAAAALFGWGLFNVIEGILDHHLLHLHHVVEARGESVYDVLFLLSGVVFMGAGWVGMTSWWRKPVHGRA